ncbi:MAG: ATP-binding cassette domain-containing protein [Bacilli bacterium]|nr:ATP-binding cassette domain-containing protein [Bacilli bacterium]
MKIELINLNKIFNDKVIFENVNLKIEKNGFYILKGGNGSGKTTLFRIITGLEKSTSGILKINNEIVNDLPTQKRKITFVTQNRFLYTNLNVYENLAFALKICKYSDKQIKEKIDKIVKLFEINGLLNKNPSQLSTGEKQKIIISKALLKDNNIILLDEPFNNLDIESKTKLQKVLIDLMSKKIVILVTHESEEKFKNIDSKKLIIKNKKILEID